MSDVSVINTVSVAFSTEHAVLESSLALEEYFKSPALGTLQASPSRPQTWVLNLDDGVGSELYSAATLSKMAQATPEIVAGAKLLGWNAPLLALFIVGQRVLGQSSAAFVLDTTLSAAVQQILTQLASDPEDLHRLKVLFAQIQNLSVSFHLDSAVLSQLMQAYDQAAMAFIKFQIARDPQVVDQVLQLAAELGLPQSYVQWRMQADPLLTQVSAATQKSDITPPYLWWNQSRESEAVKKILDELPWYVVDFQDVAGATVH